MNYILDILACGTIVFAEIFGIFIIAILIQGIIYRLTEISLYNTMKTGIEKEIYSDQTILSLKK